jgi:hypothetical protein
MYLAFVVFRLLQRSGAAAGRQNVVAAASQ